jgi:hypothetical protein
MNESIKEKIKNHIKIGNIVKEGNDHIIVEYNTDEVSSIISDDMIAELCPILESGMNVDLFDSEGNFFSDNDSVIRARVGF